MAYDLSANNATITTEIKSSVEEVIAKHNSLTSATQTGLNTLETAVADLETAIGGDTTTIANQITALQDLLDNDSMDIVVVLDGLADAVNAMDVSKRYTVAYTTNTGSVTLDLTALGFTATTDYSVTVTCDNNQAIVSATKTSATLLTFDIRDAKHFIENNVAWDGTTTALDLSVLVSSAGSDFSMTANISGGTAVIGA